MTFLNQSITKFGIAMVLGMLGTASILGGTSQAAQADSSGDSNFSVFTENLPALPAKTDPLISASCVIAADAINSLGGGPLHLASCKSVDKNTNTLTVVVFWNQTKEPTSGYYFNDCEMVAPIINALQSADGFMSATCTEIYYDQEHGVPYFSLSVLTEKAPH